MNCPICTQPLTDFYPKPRCRRCGYVESCGNPEIPCTILTSQESADTPQETLHPV
ncbi:MAG: hypothetical protein M3Y28_12005 [Armatimonadota bacterium]|nr:hypothetical protein [Armatimonadota bacterium]